MDYNTRWILIVLTIVVIFSWLKVLFTGFEVSWWLFGIAVIILIAVLWRNLLYEMVKGIKNAFIDFLLAVKDAIFRTRRI